MKNKQEDREQSQIQEGEGRFPWWVWGVIAMWLIYAFFIAPFEISWPI